MIVLKTILLFLVFLLSTVLVFSAEEAHFISEYITSLNSSTFEKFVSENEFVLVTFFAPWCGHCTALEPEFKATCAEMATSIPKVRCGSVDATENMELAQQFGVSGYPTIKLFNGTENIQNFSGARSKENFLRWISKLTGPAIQIVDSMSEATEIASSSSSAFIGHLSSKDSTTFTNFEVVAASHREHSYPFIVVLGSSEEQLHILHKDEETVVIPMPKTLEKLESKISVMNVPLFAAISADNYSLYMSRPGFTAWFCGTTEDFNKYASVIRKVASHFREEYAFVFLDTDQFGSHATQHLLIEEFPGLVVQSVAVPAIRYLYGGLKFDSEEPLMEFMNSVASGKHEMSIKSEPVPSEQTGPVTVVVGHTFEEIVFQKDKDVLIEIYAQWCGHCKNLEPIYNQLAEEMKDNENIVIAKINGPANDIPFEGFSPRAFPTILFVRAGTRTAIPYDGKRTVEAFKEFITEHATVSQSSTHDEL
ncbi:disulfide isomerase protein, putative [Cryptosporidium muris RN66]|uniref:protein disulfide-isomerase n=1 Tax=Cryptosporidium muris (strain RN66) TaxID=441375 RepID=B6ABP7_CRYMR|nr:disulfide isomerase protein, putative [Cryptosporidium muris RN66]EEA05799.1 disulfide isomerase protein, putative [Cryptosporidium muris RN66]|eukprot:XP_002140148.1 disulfide isomerase protein [Cryptosporidium muris RN66]